MFTEPLSADLLLSDPEEYLKGQWVGQYQNMNMTTWHIYEYMDMKPEIWEGDISNVSHIFDTLIHY